MAALYGCIVWLLDGCIVWLYCMAVPHLLQTRFRCWAPSAEPKLGEIPQLRALMAEAGQKLDGLDAFLHTVQMSLSKNLTEVTNRN